jgi:Ran GTPase-activating protein (RanGAP) involved in mRNA processing and transport
MGLLGLSKALIENETLEEIYLYNNEIDDDSMRDFANMLKNKKKLRIVGLEYNKIRNGAEWVFEVLKTLPVERVMLSQNGIQPSIGESI